MNSTNDTVTLIWSANPLSAWQQVLLWLLVIVLSVETIVGNAMVIIAYRLDRAISKQINNRYIVSLAVSDLIIGVEGFPLFTVYVANGDRWPLGSMACETWLFLDYTLCLVSILTVLLITVDRYMSVCHTASYLKWQSPTKTQWMIILSWLLPAVVFGIMIYGWSAMTGESRENDSTECAAPFLANPYVNMSMYLAYYWTTLIAMLLLYKGIHKAAKHLEKRADAKEKRNIALILSQRLGTQVGVTLVLQSHASPPSLGNEENNEAAVIIAEENLLKDSGYTTLTTGLSTAVAHQQPNVVYEEPLEEMDVAGVSRGLPIERSLDAPSFVAAADQHGAMTKSANGSIVYASDSCSYNITSDHDGPQKTLNAAVHASEGSLDYTAADAASLLEAFMDDSFSSVLQMRNRGDSTSPTDSTFSLSDVLASDATSEIIRQSVRRRKQSSAKQPTTHKPSVKFSPIPSESCKQLPLATERPLIQLQPQRIVRKNSRSEQAESWTASLRRMVANALAIKPLRATQNPVPRSSTSSTSSTDSSHPSNRQQLVKPTTSKSDEQMNKMAPPPMLMVTSAHDNDSMQEIADLPGDNIDSFLSPDTLNPTGHKNVTRKVSSLSATANYTKQRMMATIYTPFAAIQRRRKKTKAERRAQKAFRTITFIVGFFALLWSPYYIVATVYGFCKEGCVPPIIYTISYYLCYLNSSGNPFAYALANRQFRMAFYRIMRGNFSRTR
uniref:G-protein coupled receptors family 1 profile domain-containing protein n=1 Tax=Plectus sambesii TaxID=2011161 RepID=A0A914VFR4_9BILA